MNSEKIALWKHIVNAENLAEIIDNLDGILQSELTLLGNSLSSVNANRDWFAAIKGCFGKSFHIFKLANRKSQKL